MSVVCRSCKAPVLYARNDVTGKMQILDARPDLERGNVVVDVTGAEPRCRILDGDAARTAREQGAATYLSHFATCPEAKRWRKRRR